jgi:hypothetical protein
MQTLSVSDPPKSLAACEQYRLTASVSKKEFPGGFAKARSVTPLPDVSRARRSAVILAFTVGAVALLAATRFPRANESATLG